MLACFAEVQLKFTLLQAFTYVQYHTASYLYIYNCLTSCNGLKLYFCTLLLVSATEYVICSLNNDVDELECDEFSTKISCCYSYGSIFILNVNCCRMMRLEVTDP